MRIGSSTIGMESARRYSSSQKRSSRYGVMDYNKAADAQKQDVGEKGQFADMNQIRERFQKVTLSSTNLRTRGDVTENFRQLSLKYIFSLMFGSEKANELFREQTAVVKADPLSMEQLNSNQYLVYSNQISFYEKETTSFQASGTVKTADGREINFKVDVEMSREFSAYYEENYQIASIQTCDPLVINLKGDIAKLTDQKFFFDLDGDGGEEEIAALSPDSGYLALDKNGDGKINDGKELFGPQSGNGFGDLAAYDDDGNGWIDEEDHIWSKLKIWCKTEDGTDKLYTLKESGVGAICLQSAATDFTLGNLVSAGGFIRKTGIFLYENGNVGTMQHLDLAH